MKLSAVRALRYGAILMVALVVATAPAAAAHTPVVASHTTASEFSAGTLTNMTTYTSEGEGMIAGIPGSTADTGAGEATASTTQKKGVTFEPATDLSAVTVTLHDGVSGATHAYLTELDGTVIDAVPLNGSDTVTLHGPLAANTEYVVSVDAAGSSYTEEEEQTAAYPYTSADVNITSGWTASGGRTGGGFSYNIKEVTAITEPTTANYTSASHDADAVEGFVNATIRNATVDVTWQGYDGSSWVTVATDTLTTTGNHTQALGAAYSEYRVQLDAANDGGGVMNVQVYEEGVAADTAAPLVANTTASPSGKEEVTTATATLQVDVTDADFGTGQSDSLTAEFFVNGSSVGTDTLSSNGTASYDYTVTTGGARTWSVEVTDSYGHITTSETFDWRAPGTLYIRNVSNASQLVDNPTNVTVQFVGSDQVIEKTTTDGTVSLSGVPINQEIVVTASANGYYDRTILINDIFQQDSIYLLNQTAAANEVRFVLDDVTGEYTAESDLILVRPVTENGTTEFKTVVADQFGVEGVTTHLADGQRYRVKIRDSDDNVQDLGPFRSDVAETVTVRPGAPTIQFENYTEEYAANATLDNTTLEFAYSDPDGETTSLTVFVHERGNVSNQLTPNRTYSNLGNVSGTYTLTSNQSDDDWVVNFIVERGGEEFTLERVVSNNPNLVPPLSREWRLVAGIGLLLISAGVFSLLNAGVGGVIVAIEGGVLWWTGFLEGATTGIAVVIALFVAVLFHVYRSRAV